MLRYVAIKIFAEDRTLVTLGMTFIKPERYLRPCQASVIELFCENSEWILVVTCLHKKLHHRSLTGF